ncbi:MAG: phosphoribosylanthranilate isomerase [Candidatus Aureabacteria bacterium]|nr:phosphoribosylanthranilate isomerase [Candidatus Auribacterota bacterium]
MNIKIKICGMTDLDNASDVLEMKPDYMGFVMYPESTRYAEPEKVKNIISLIKGKVLSVGVFVNEDPKKVHEYVNFCGFDLIQLHGSETADEVENYIARGIKVIKAFNLKDSHTIESAKKYSNELFLFDAFQKDMYGGTGRTIQKDLLSILNEDEFLSKKDIFISGGLYADNIASVLTCFSPFAVDASSKLESVPGIKDIEKVRAFIDKVREFSS